MSAPHGVLFLTHVGDPGGAEFKMLDLCRSVADDAEILLFQHGSLESILTRRSLRYSVCPLPRAAREMRREGGLMSLFRAIPGVLTVIGSLARKARGFRIVVCVSQKSFVLAALAKCLMRRPIVWFMNDIVSREHFSAISIRCITFLSRYLADYVVLNSEASRAAWLRAGGRARRVSVIYPVMMEDEVAAESDNPDRLGFYQRMYRNTGRPLIGMFGRISRWKGQDVFMRAIALLPQVDAVIAGAAHFGEQQVERNLRSLARELGIEERLHFAGHVNDPLQLMRCCDVVAHCSTAPEPFGQVILQAMLVGTPVVASDAGGAREIVIQDETGQLTPMNDPRALAEAIQRYLDNPYWSRCVAAKARHRAKKSFSAAGMAERFTAILGTL